ncbi:hypothetical protein ACWGNZ_00575 [Sphingomonas zeae]
MEIDPRYAYLEDGKGNRFQILKPAQYEERPIIGEDGEPTGRVERIELPREWDEEATVKAMQAA